MGFELDSKRAVLNSYGVRTTNGKFGGQQSTKNGIIKSAIWDFSYNDLPSATASNLQQVIPANATIVSSKFYVDVAFASTSGTTDLDVGFYTSANVAIDADGLHTAASLTQTTIAVAGAVYAGTGALVGFTIGATAGELVVTPTVADLTAGKGRVVVEYVLDEN